MSRAIQVDHQCSWPKRNLQSNYLSSMARLLALPEHVFDRRVSSVGTRHVNAADSVDRNGSRNITAFWSITNDRELIAIRIVCDGRKVIIVTDSVAATRD